MEDSLTFLYIVFFISILVLIIAAVVAGAFVIPLQVKEFAVKNGLAKLRRQLLLKGTLSFAMIIIAVAVLSLRYVIHDLTSLRYITVSLVLLFSLSFLAHVCIDYFIYRQNYTDEMKKFHEKVEALEKSQKKE